MSKNLQGIWYKDEVHEIYEDIANYKILYVRPMTNGTNYSTDILKLWHYEVLLIDCTTDYDIQVNLNLIELGKKL